MARSAWEEIYERDYPRLYRALIAMGARKDEAEDALHDAFAKALRVPSQIDRPDAWLFRVAVRAWRRRRVRERIFRPLALFDRPTPPPDGTRVTLLSELARLPLRQRQVLVARYVLGFTQEETAALLGMARGTVSATTTQATGHLRRRLSGGD